MKHLVGLILVAIIIFVIIPEFVKVKEFTETTTDEISVKARKLGKTPEFQKLLQTPEFADVILTKEFRNFMLVVGKKELLKILGYTQI